MDNTSTGVKQEELTTSPTSPVEENKPVEKGNSNEETSKLKILGNEKPKSSDADWDNQPEVATKNGETSQKNEEKSQITESKEEIGLLKEKERVTSKVEVLRQELKTLREQKRALSQEKEQIDNQDSYSSEPTEYQEAEKTVESLLDKKMIERESKELFYHKHPDFYQGDEGVKNKQMIEDYLNLRYDAKKMPLEAVSELRELIHHKYFGEFEKDALVRETKTKTQQEAMQNEIAALGSDKGRTQISSTTPERKRILTKQKPVTEWY